MKKILLLAVAATMVTSASAQLQRSKNILGKALPKTELTAKPMALQQEMHKATNGTPIMNAPKKADYIDAFYSRPAGAFTGYQYMEDGAWGGGFYAPYLMMKPFTDWTFKAYAEGTGPEHYFVWDYMTFMYDETQGWYQDWVTVMNQDELTLNYDLQYDEVPILYVAKGDAPDFIYQMGGWNNGTKIASELLAYPTFSRAFGEEEETMLLLQSSKTFCYGGRYGDQEYLMTYYSGCEPYGKNEDGWWFGKNGGRSNGMPIDGIAQAFEKPQSSYLLKQVVLETTGLMCVAPVEMTCKIYKIDGGIPAYDPSSSVALPEVPGELIAEGRGTVTPETNEANDGFIVFTLYGEEDGLEYEVTPTIDDAILVVIDGYNDPSMDNLRDFSALISSDTEADEGFGELAYIKYGLSDEDGTFSGDYVWAGLNNFFSSGSGGLGMKTGLSIFIVTESPFLTYNWNNEDGEFLFPDEGGLMEKDLGMGPDGEVITRSIEFFAWVPSVDEGWMMTCDGDDVPEWLSIELTDGEDEDGSFNNVVNAEVVAEPLPEGVTYREAIVRFEFPGAYLDYKFMQGEKPDDDCGMVGDVNNDKEINIADINALLDIILGASADQCTRWRADMNGDGEIGLADVNALSDFILSHS